MHVLVAPVSAKFWLEGFLRCLERNGREEVRIDPDSGFNRGHDLFKGQYDPGSV